MYEKNALKKKGVVKAKDIEINFNDIEEKLMPEKV